MVIQAQESWSMSQVKYQELDEKSSSRGLVSSSYTDYIEEFCITCLDRNLGKI